MSLTNPNKVVTEQRLNEYHNAILPYLGGMPEMVANKFSKGDLYSTEERMIGQWIDGKPLYQKTIDCGALPNATTKQIAHNITNAEMMRVADAFAFSSGNAIPIPFVTTNAAHSVGIEVAKVDNVKISCTQDYSGFLSSYVTLQYTKTTDSPISIGSDTDYSTEEKIVGTWIDGKPLYQRTFVLDNQITVSNTSWTSTEIDVSYINVLVNINSPLATGQQNWFAISASMQNNILYLLAARDNASAYIKYFTLQYTKNTD